MVHLDYSIGTVAPYTANRRRKPHSRLTPHLLPSYLERFDWVSDPSPPWAGS